MPFINFPAREINCKLVYYGPGLGGKTANLQWVYDNTFKNATRAKLSGDLVEGAYGGIPFPEPKNGSEVMWNHILRWRGTSWQFQVTQYQLTADGKAVLTFKRTALIYKRGQAPTIARIRPPD